MHKLGKGGEGKVFEGKLSSEELAGDYFAHNRRAIFFV